MVSELVQSCFLPIALPATRIFKTMYHCLIKIYKVESRSALKLEKCVERLFGCASQRLDSFQPLPNDDSLLSRNFHQVCVRCCAEIMARKMSEKHGLLVFMQ